MRRAFPRGPALYCITDTVLSPLGHAEQCRAMLAGGARIIQFRDKALGPAARLAAAREMRVQCTAAGALFIVNDDADLALACGADGLHIGQDDMPPAQARARIGEAMLLGYSTHSRAQLHAALREPVDQISVGPVFGTTTKANADAATGVELVAEALALCGNRPVVAIGGISAGNIRTLRAAAPGAIVAVIGAIVAAPDIAEAVRRFREMVEG